ncbi:MAG: HAD family phosphatase [Chloroflexi bacterium]|nr:HAD family phosphatase [Chloroflexota bacterium]
MIAIDLDGTLLNNFGQLPANGSDLIKKAFDAGIHIIISTTRNYKYVQQICTRLKINDPIVCANGSIIFESPNGTLWQEHLIPPTVAERICQIADDNDWELSISIGEMTYLKQRPGQTLGQLNEHTEIVANNRAALVGQPHRILTWHLQAIKEIQELCQNEFLGMCRTEVFNKPSGELHSLGIFAQDANKGVALRFVLAKLGIEPNQVMAIGDNNNDLPMFDLAKFKVAMGNSTDAIKQMATIIAPSNEDEGVAWALEKYVFKKLVD